MQGALQAKVYGSGREGYSGTKKLGAYNGGAIKRMGHTNGAI